MYTVHLLKRTQMTFTKLPLAHEMGEKSQGAPMACFFAALPPVDLCGTFPRGAAESLPRGLASSGLARGTFPHHCWDRTDIYTNK